MKDGQGLEVSGADANAIEALDFLREEWLVFGKRFDRFMAAADKCQPTIIGMSALLTTTMTYMKQVIDGFEAAGRGHIKMAIGGAPISQMFADEIGADGYGQNASAAVDLFLRLARDADAAA